MISLKCDYYYLEATRWMWGPSTFEQHRILCSSCQTELGRHSSDGFKCGCGRYVCPGFCIDEKSTEEAYRKDVKYEGSKFVKGDKEEGTGG